MSTLKELVEQHGLGVWLATDKHPNDKLFRPVGYSYAGLSIIGEYKTGNITSFNVGEEINLILYQEPKKTKQVYQWRAYSKTLNNWFVIEALLTAEQIEKSVWDKYEIHAGPFEVEDL